jgi:hypothetical protein
MAEINVGDTFLSCKQCGRAIAKTNSYQYTLVRLERVAFDSTPDGAGLVLRTDAGVFCSSECAAQYLLAGEVVQREQA